MTAFLSVADDLLVKKVKSPVLCSSSDFATVGPLPMTLRYIVGSLWPKSTREVTLWIFKAKTQKVRK